MTDTKPTEGMTEEQKMLLIEKMAKMLESDKGLTFLLDVLHHERARVDFKIEISVSRPPAKQKD